MPDFDDELRPISEAFGSFCQEAELELVSEAVERHGSVEWCAVRGGRLNRYITLALTPADAPSFPFTRGYRGEIWIEADDNQRFARLLTDVFTICKPVDD